MVKRTYSKEYNEEPDTKTFDVPSEKEHCFQVTDIFTCEDEIGQKLGLDMDTISVKLEVVNSEEAGRTLLQRLSLDENWKGFFATRLFLKGIGEEYKGKGLSIDTDRWTGRRLHATVIHNGKYANINQINFEKRVENSSPIGDKPPVPAEDIKWDE